MGGEHPDLHMGILQAALSRSPHAHGSSPETHPVACSLGRGSALRARPLSARGPDVAATHWVHHPRGSPSICGCSLVLSCCPTPTASSRKPSGLFYHTFPACLVGHLPDPLHCLLLRVISLWGPWSRVPLPVIMSPLHSAASFHPSKLVAPTNFCRPNSWSPSSHLLANPSPEERLATQWAPSSAPNSTMVAGGWCLWLSTQATFGAWEAVGSSHRGGPPNLYLPICIMVGGSRPMGNGGHARHGAGWVPRKRQPGTRHRHSSVAMAGPHDWPSPRMWGT